MIVLRKIRACYTDKFEIFKRTFYKGCQIFSIPEEISQDCTKENIFKTKDLNLEQLSNIVSNSFCNHETIFQELQLAVNKHRLTPEFISNEQLNSLCNLKSRTQRCDYLIFLFKREKIRQNDLLKKEQKKKAWELKLLQKAEAKCDIKGLQNGVRRNSLFLNVRDRSLNSFYTKKWANALLFGEKLVLDLGYDDFMTDKEKSHCASQLAHVYSYNRRNPFPFDLYYCNASSKCVEHLLKKGPKIKDTLIHLSEKSYLDIFPKEKLVYLSPHAPETLKEYDHSAIYVIGAFVDTVKREHISLQKAEEQGIKSFKLPLDDYILWGCGTKSLTINQVFEIMLTLKNTGSWRKAFDVIPPRKIRKLEPHQIEKNIPEKMFLIKQSN